MSFMQRKRKKKKRQTLTREIDKKGVSLQVYMSRKYHNTQIHTQEVDERHGSYHLRNMRDFDKNYVIWG